MIGERLDAERHSPFGSRHAAVSGSMPVGGEGPSPQTPGRRLPLSWWRRVLVLTWLAGAVLTWNTVFDAHIVAGARGYVDGQQAFIDGRGPHLDIDQAMTSAKASGVRAAWRWTAVELAPAIAVAAVWRWRARRRRAR